MIEKLKQLVSKQFHIDVESLTETSSIEDICADSLDVVDMLMSIEDNFGVIIPDEDVPGLKTIKDVADYIDSHSNN